MANKLEPAFKIVVPSFKLQVFEGVPQVTKSVFNLSEIQPDVIMGSSSACEGGKYIEYQGFLSNHLSQVLKIFLQSFLKIFLKYFPKIFLKLQPSFSPLELLVFDAVNI